MTEEMTNQGLGESHSPEADKLAESITEMISAVSAEHNAAVETEKEPPALPPELEKLLNEEVPVPEDAEEEPVEAGVQAEQETEDETENEENEEPVSEEIKAEEPLSEPEPSNTEPEPAEIETKPAEVSSAVSETVPEEEPAEKEETATVEEASTEEETSPAEEAETVTEPDLSEEPEAAVRPVFAESDVTATDPDALFVKEPPTDGSRYLLTPDTDGDKFRESVAEICDNIRTLLPEKKGCAVIAVTSAGRGEGKSSAALLLAMALAAGKKVLLADCDFTSPQLHKYFNCVNKKGVLNAAEGECSLADVALNTDMSGLKFVTAGLLKDGKDVDPDKVAACLTDGEDFDFAVCDLPSLNKCGYASVLAKAADGTVVVARSGVTGYPALSKAVKKLKKAEAELLGVVLNGR